MNFMIMATIFTLEFFSRRWQASYHAFAGLFLRGVFVIRPVYAFPLLSIHYFDMVEALSRSTLITCKYLNDINVALSYLPLLLYFGRTRLATYL
jgi:hypothetical protein